MLRLPACLALSVLFYGACFGQSDTRSLGAVKIASVRSPQAGLLNDSSWQGIPAATNFISYNPIPGNPSRRRTLVQTAYDNTAIYIHAYLYDTAAKISRQFTARDGEYGANTDYFAVGLDTYHDLQNGFLFVVTAAGVQGDGKVAAFNLGQNSNPYADPRVDNTWDAVWESKVTIQKDGWVVDMKIPFSALRFARKPDQDWGIQFFRFIKRYNELSTWNSMNPNLSGLASQWGVLKGLKDITPPLRLAFLPYISTGLQSQPFSASPKSFATQKSINGGMDIKYGFSESFTLDMTLIPDFGQVQSDNTVLNLQPYEVKYDEQRPFFTEGTELFNKSGIFYSRRIGKVGDLPLLYDSVYHQLDTGETVVKNPGSIQLYNATKVSGRTKKGLGIGFLNAVTAPAYAVIRNNAKGTERRMETEPLTNYNVIVVDQALRHQSSVTFTNTSVIRKGRAADANVSAFDLALYNPANTYGLFADGRLSQVFDREKNNTGFSTALKGSKVSGRFQFDVSNILYSDTYDPNDLGIIQYNNQALNQVNARYNINQSTRYFIVQSYGLSLQQNYLYHPFTFQETLLDGSAHVIFHNFYDIGINGELAPVWYNDFFEPRVPGRFLKRIPYYTLSTFGSSDSRKKLFAGFTFQYGNYTMGNGDNYLLDIPVRYRIGDRWSVSLESSWQHLHNNYGFADTLNKNVIIGSREVTTIQNIFSTRYFFTPLMNLDFRIRHYWSNVVYGHYYLLENDGNRTNTGYAGNRNLDFNAFNIDMIYTWNFRLGSQFIFDWKNYLSPAFPPAMANDYFKNVSNLLNTPHTNEVSLKFIYYLDYLTLKRRT